MINHLVRLNSPNAHTHTQIQGEKSHLFQRWYAHNDIHADQFA